MDTLEAEYFHILDRMQDMFESDGNGETVPYGWRYTGVYLDMPNGEVLCAHLLQRGFIVAAYRYGRMCYCITPQGSAELERLRTPPDKTKQIKAEIQRLEQALWAKREELAALQPGSVEQQIAKRWHGYEGK